MNDLGITNDGTISDNFATIPDVSIDAIASRVTPQQVTSGVTRGTQYLGSANVYSDGGNSQIIVKDSTVPRILMGNQATFGEGFYVSKNGIDATKNSDPSQWIFNSNQNVFKIAKTDTLTSDSFTINTGANVYGQNGNTTSKAHGLTYRPALLAYLTDATQSIFWQVPHSSIYSMSTAGFVFFFVEVSVDATNVYLNVNTYGYNQSATINPVTVKYYLLQESAG